jgi:hypothetical protein
MSSNNLIPTESPSSELGSTRSWAAQYPRASGFDVVTTDSAPNPKPPAQ